MATVSEDNVYNPNGLPLDTLIKQLEQSRDKFTKGEVEVEFGGSSSLMLDMTTIVNNFMGKLFDMTVDENKVKKYALDNNISEEEARETMKMKCMIKMKTVPDSSGNRPDSEQTKEDGGVANLVKTFVKLITKVLGFACEIFINLLKPLQVLIQQFISNPDNPGKLGDMLFTESMMASTSGTPAQAGWVAKKIIEIKKMIDNVNIVINDILMKIQQFLTDIEGFIFEQVLKLERGMQSVADKGNELIEDIKEDIKDKKENREDKVHARAKRKREKALERKKKREARMKKQAGKKEGSMQFLGMSFPGFPLGFAGINLPKIDPNNTLEDNESPLSLGFLALAGIGAINLANLLFNPKDELNKMGFDTSKMSDTNINIEMPKLNMDEINFYKKIYSDPIQQFNYIKALKKHNYINHFYRQEFNTETGKYENLFDFFKDFDLYPKEDIDESKEEQNKSLMECLEESDLLKDKTFILNFYKLIESYKTNLPSISDKLEKDFKKKGYHFKNIKGKQITLSESGFLYRKGLKFEKPKNIDNIYGNIVEELKTDEDTFKDILELSFDLNFWNTHLVDDKKYVHVVGEDTYDYKKFKYDFFCLIPEHKLKYFISHNYTYILYYQENIEFKNNLSVDFTTILRYSNDMVINGENIKGALSDNNFRRDVNLPPKFERLFDDEYYDPNTGLPNIRPKSISSSLGDLKDNIPGLLSSLFITCDFFRELIMMPLNFLLGFIEKILGIILDAITINLPGAFSKLLSFIKDLMPTMDFFEKVGESVLKPFMNLFEKSLGKMFEKSGGEGMDMSSVSELYLGHVQKMFKLLLSDAIPNLLMDTLTELFLVVIRSITDMIPIIKI